MYGLTLCVVVYLSQVLQRIRGDEDIEEEFESIKHNCERTEEQKMARSESSHNVACNIKGNVYLAKAIKVGF